jgi:hypothetical protein
VVVDVAAAHLQIELLLRLGLGVIIIRIKECSSRQLTMRSACEAEGLTRRYGPSSI